MKRTIVIRILNHHLFVGKATRYLLRYYYFLKGTIRIKARYSNKHPQPDHPDQRVVYLCDGNYLSEGLFMKSFVDFFMISKAERVFCAHTYRMYPSLFPLSCFGIGWSAIQQDTILAHPAYLLIE